MVPKSTAGESAWAEYRRRRDARLERGREGFGAAAPLALRLGGEPAAERSWRVGAPGEERVARRLERLLSGSEVRVIHDLRIPGSPANIDHICVGPGGVTVVDIKGYRGRVRVRGGELLIDGHRRTPLVDGVRRQVDVVRATLRDAGLASVQVVGAICCAGVDGLPLLRRQALDGVRIDGPRPIARWAARASGSPCDVELVAAALIDR